MQVTITLNDVTPAMAKAIADLVASHNATATATATKALPAPTTQQPKAAPAQVAEPLGETDAPAPVAEKPKRAPKAVAPAAAPAAAPAGPTLDDVRAAARVFMEARGPEALAAIIADFGAKKMSDVKPAQYPELLAKFQAGGESALD